MNPIVEKRRAILINVAYFALLLAIFYLIFKTFFGILVPFISAFLFAALLQKPVNFITKKTPVKRSAASAGCVLLLLCLALSLFFLAGMGIFGKIKEFIDYMTLRVQNLSDFTDDIKKMLFSAISFLPDTIRLKLTDSITIFFNDIVENGLENFTMSSLGGIDWSGLLSKGGGVIKDTVVQIPSVAIACVVSVVACAFMTADYNRLVGFMRNQLSEKNAQKISAAAKLASETFRKMIKAYSLIILVTWTELTIGFYILKLVGALHSNYIIIIAFIIAIIDIIPVLGTGTVLIPWSVYSLVTGDIKLGIGLLILYVIILVIRQIIEPKLVAGQVGLPAIVTIIAMYIGTKTLGVLGFFILPFMVILVKEFNDKGIIHIFKNTQSESADDVPVTEDAPQELTETPAE